MNRIQKWAIDREIRKCVQDNLAYGSSILVTRRRKWYNPARYLFGKIKFMYIDARDLY